jgi:NTP pyrophosphatase (non-canonical NTP hydrolase)
MQIIEAAQLALDTYGAKAQTIQAIEELSELSQILAKIANDRKNPSANQGDRGQLISEMADVGFMMMQMALAFHITDEELEDATLHKAKRLADRIEYNRNWGHNDGG